jgi:hypothetical protein
MEGYTATRQALGKGYRCQLDENPGCKHRMKSGILPNISPVKKSGFYADSCMLADCLPICLPIQVEKGGKMREIVTETA